MAIVAEVETAKDRKELVSEAGLGKLSFWSVLSGAIVAFGAFAVLGALAGGIAGIVGANTDFVTGADPSALSIGGAVVAAVILFLAYLWGGYVAGRMARRSGAFNGGMVFVLGVVIAGILAAVAGAVATTTDVTTTLSNRVDALGVPTTSSDGLAGVFTVAGIVLLVAMLAGAIVGGLLGERWHTKLVRRALDPEFGPAADRRRAEAKDRDADRTHGGGATAETHDRDGKDAEAAMAEATRASEEAARQSEVVGMGPVAAAPTADHNGHDGQDRTKVVDLRSDDGAGSSATQQTDGDESPIVGPDGRPLHRNEH